MPQSRVTEKEDASVKSNGKGRCLSQELRKRKMPQSRVTERKMPQSRVTEKEDASVKNHVIRQMHKKRGSSEEC